MTRNKSFVMIITATTDLSALNMPVNKVEFRSMPTNTQTVWFNIGSAPVQGWSYPLDIGDGKEDIYIDNLSELQFLFDSANDKIALIYEVQQ